MNRQQRRLYNKQHKTNYSKQDFDIAEAFRRVKEGNMDLSDLDLPYDVMHLDSEEIAPSGIKCKLNVEGIMKRPATMLTEEFVKWVYENQDKEFTLSRENVKNSLVGLAEDCAEAENKKLFDLFTELLIFDEENQEYVMPEVLQTRKYESSNDIVID